MSPRNVTRASRPRQLPGGEDARVREQLNALVSKFGVICDTLDADAGVTGTTFAAVGVDATDAPNLVGGIGGTVVVADPTPPPVEPPVEPPQVATQLAVVAQPLSATKGQALGAIVIEARDSAGARVNGFAGTISLSLQNGGGTGTSRNVVLRASANGLTPVDLAPIAVAEGGGGGGSTLPAPNYAMLPVAEQSTAPVMPDYGWAAAMRAAAAGTVSTFAPTGVAVLKLSDASQGSYAQHDYSTTFPSWGWFDANGVLHHSVYYDCGGLSWRLVDIRDADMAITRSVVLPPAMQPGSDWRLMWSLDPQTPRVLYRCGGRTVRKFDSATLTEIVDGVWPRTFSTQEVSGTCDLVQIESEMTDSRFTFLDGAASSTARIILWDSVANAVQVIAPADVDAVVHGGFQGAIVPKGVLSPIHVALSDGEPSTPGMQWSRWRSWDGSVLGAKYGPAVAYSGHACTTDHANVTIDVNSTTRPLVIHRFNPTTLAPVIDTPMGSAGRFILGRGYHISSAFGRGTTDATRWVYPSSYEFYSVPLANWTSQGGGIWMAQLTASSDWVPPETPNSYTTLGFMSRISAVHRRTGGTTFTQSLARQASLQDLSTATDAFFFDKAQERLYVRLASGAQPDANWVATPAGAPFNAITALRLDGGDGRVVVPTHGATNSYWHLPRATVSPDGLLVMWTSDMGVQGGRTDVYAARVPRSI